MWAALLSYQLGSSSSEREMSRNDWSHMILRDHHSALCMKPSGGLNKATRFVITFLMWVASLSDRLGSSSSERETGRDDWSYAALRGHHNALCMKPSGGSNKTSRMVTTVLMWVAAMSDQF